MDRKYVTMDRNGRMCGSESERFFNEHRGVNCRKRRRTKRDRRMFTKTQSHKKREKSSQILATICQANFL